MNDYSWKDDFSLLVTDGNVMLMQGYVTISLRKVTHGSCKPRGIVVSTHCTFEITDFQSTDDLAQVFVRCGRDTLSQKQFTGRAPPMYSSAQRIEQ